MKHVRYTEFTEEIAKDFGISIQKEYVLQLPADKKTIKSFTISRANDVRIFDGVQEHPYIFNKPGTQRNEEALANGKELRYLGYKGLVEILEVAGNSVTTKSCRICEGGGWSSEGTRYMYKEIYCEI